MAAFPTAEEAREYCAAQGMYVRARGGHGITVLKCAEHVECFQEQGSLLRTKGVEGVQKARSGRHTFTAPRFICHTML